MRLKRKSEIAPATQAAGCGHDLRGNSNADLCCMAPLFEGDADPPLLAPHHPAGPVTSVRRDEQREVRGDANGAGDVKGGADGRPVSDGAVDRAAAKLNGCALEDSLATGAALFAHRGGLYTRIPNGKIGFDDLSGLPARVAAEG